MSIMCSDDTQKPAKVLKLTEVQAFQEHLYRRPPQTECAGLRETKVRGSQMGNTEELPRLVGDGKTDETRAVQAWFTARRKLPPGVYLISGEIVLPNEDEVDE